MSGNIVYLDNAASSWPKPPEVIKAMKQCMDEFAANPGRGSHQLSLKASRAIYKVRNTTANFFGVKNPNDIIFTQNTTHALNLALFGFLKESDHVICTNVEHNSVIRPLEYLKKYKNIEISYLITNSEGELNFKQLEELIRINTKLIVVNHSSNLLGCILPISDIAEVCKKNHIKLLIDAAQTAGVLPIDVNKLGIDMLAFPGHKSLMGPQGTGGLYIHPEIDLKPLIYGGTGSFSEKIYQPDIRPDIYESGTQNTVGIVGLEQGINFITNKTIKKIYDEEWEHTQNIIEQLRSFDRVKILGPSLTKKRTGIVSFTVNEVDSSEIAFKLDKLYNIAVRSGLQCTPSAHKLTGTLKTGAVRVSVGCYTKVKDVDSFIYALKDILQS